MTLGHIGCCIYERSLRCETGIFVKWDVHDYKYQNAGWLGPIAPSMSLLIKSTTDTLSPPESVRDALIYV